MSELLAALATTPVAATRSGLAHALIALATLFHGHRLTLPGMVGAYGRWPTGPQGSAPVEPADRPSSGPAPPAAAGGGAPRR